MTSTDPVTWGRAFSGRVAHIVPADASHTTVQAACGLRIYVYWTWDHVVGRACPKCEAVQG